MKQFLSLSACTLEYDFTRKAVKNINLRVKEGRVSVSAPKGVPLATVEAFLLSKEAFLLSALSRQRQTKASLFGGVFPQSGETVTLFGKAYTLILLEGRASAALTEEQVILTFSEEAGRKRALSELIRALSPMFFPLFDRVWQDFLFFCKSNFARSDMAQTAFFREGCPKPAVSFRAMRSRWGSCNPTKKKITFSYMLLEKEPSLIAGVVAHELLHLVVPDHSSRFHHLLDLFSPDNRLLRKKLNER